MNFLAPFSLQKYQTLVAVADGVSTSYSGGFSIILAGWPCVKWCKRKKKSLVVAAFPTRQKASEIMGTEFSTENLQKK